MSKEKIKTINWKAITTEIKPKQVRDLDLVREHGQDWLKIIYKENE